ncbi:COX15/CtaA family protein [Nocardioides sp.]|uniref:COX15/CtaA family protein n=1 Tax=Nocardioides sp. TaxID=35761 RepID=UPI002615F8FE|nr:COX15/CtaA family protein [Nocardioides sp.]
MQKYLRPLAWATLIANIGIIVTGGVVRLTGSGLGCDTWPRCNGEDFTPHAELNHHSIIEFANRMLTWVLVAIAIATVVAAWRTTHRRLTVAIACGIPAQAVIGGITVLADLNPWIVSLHMVASLVIVSFAVLLLWRIYQPAGRVVTATTPIKALTIALAATTAAVLYAGTVVTGAGPHAGDADAPRNGLSTLELSQVHADLVCLLIGLTIGILALVWRTDACTAALALFCVELGQGAIGWIQYFTDLPTVLVGFHMLGAGLTAAAAAWVFHAARTAQPVHSGQSGQVD